MGQYIVKPGALLKEYLESRKITQKQLAELIDSSEKHVSNVINNKSKITVDFALKLEKAMPDVPADFWVNLNADYELDQVRKKKLKEKFKDVDLKKIAKDYQFSTVFKELKYSKEQQAEKTLNILGVESFEQANRLLEESNNMYMHDGGNEKARFLWTKLAENEIDLQNNLEDIKAFNAEKLKMKLPKIKASLNNTNYKEALENTRKHLNECGVALVLLEAVPTSKVRGATTIASNIHAIYLSTRFKRIDVLYFALIHEIYHILNNDFSKITTYVTAVDSNDEIEANNFSKNFFIAEDIYEELVSKDVNYLTESFIREIAKRSGVVVDVVIGFLERYHKNQMKIYHWFAHLITRIDN